jgi:hypothetical protein
MLGTQPSFRRHGEGTPRVAAENRPTIDEFPQIRHMT